MKKFCLLLVSIMIALCVTACTPKTDNSLDAQIERSQSALEQAKKRKEAVDKEAREVQEKLDKIDRMQKALS